MTERYPYLYRSMQALALALVLAALAFPGWLAQNQLVPAIALILLAGIPHGATDYLIFRHLSRPFLGTRAIHRFYLHYLLLMLAYGLIWYFFPLPALALFLLLSMFHFGQSNWNYVAFDRKAAAWLVYLAWGGFAILTPIIRHFEEALPIITEITQAELPLITPLQRIAFCAALFVLNLGINAYLYFHRRLNFRSFVNELINLFVLLAVYFFLPLLLGFAVYFVCWHSLSSMGDQIRFFRRQQAGYDWKNYVKNSLPFSLVALLGLAALVWGQAQLGLSAGIGLLFIFISIVTLPHMILIDQLYLDWENKTGTE